MANKFARSNGDFNDASIWSGLAASMSATSVPTIGDNAIANNFVVQITGTVACDNITNGTTYGGTAGGGFNLNVSALSSTVSANIIPGATLNAHCLSAIGSQGCNFYGTINGGTGTTSYGVLLSTSGITNIYGNITGGLSLIHI